MNGSTLLQLEEEFWLNGNAFSGAFIVKETTFGLKLKFGKETPPLPPKPQSKYKYKDSILDSQHYDYNENHYNMDVIWTVINKIVFSKTSQTGFYEIAKNNALMKSMVN